MGHRDRRSDITMEYKLPKLQPLPLRGWFQARRWLLLEDWQYRGIVIPKGFITDGASVPRILYWLFEPTGILFIPAILHDYFYATKSVSRADADRIFRENVIKEGCWLAGWLAWIGVRLFGWIPWKLKRR